jgi:hypothetical protein
MSTLLLVPLPLTGKDKLGQSIIGERRRRPSGRPRAHRLRRKLLAKRLRTGQLVGSSLADQSPAAWEADASGSGTRLNALPWPKQTRGPRHRVRVGVVRDCRRDISQAIGEEHVRWTDQLEIWVSSDRARVDHAHARRASVSHEVVKLRGRRSGGNGSCSNGRLERVHSGPARSSQGSSANPPRTGTGFAAVPERTTRLQG